MPTEPQAPKSLADPEALAARRALVTAPHIAPIRALAERISAERGAPVPVPDPLDGGVAARMLLLLETPGPAVLRTGFVTRDSAQRNLGGEETRAWLRFLVPLWRPDKGEQVPNRVLVRRNSAAGPAIAGQ